MKYFLLLLVRLRNSAIKWTGVTVHTEAKVIGRGTLNLRVQGSNADAVLPDDAM